MRISHAFALGFALALSVAAFGQTSQPEPSLQSVPIDLKASGAFGFPQDKGTVLCDKPELRLSVANDDEHLFVQAVMWNDDKDELGETEDGRAIGNTSELNLDIDANGAVTPNKDRGYTLNPWPKSPGLHYAILLDEISSTTLQRDSQGRGSLMYVATTDGKTVRVDNYLIPLAEIGRKPGEVIRLEFRGETAKKKLTVRSAGEKTSDGKSSQQYTLVKNGPALPVDQVPEGRRTMGVKSAKKTYPMPTVGSEAPEVVSKKWFNWTQQDEPTLKGLRGKVVMVEFWATWCGPCLGGVPHLNELHERYGKEGLVILSVAEQSSTAIEKYVKSHGMKYPVGAESEALGLYGIRGLPQAFLVDRTGKIAWEGSPNDQAMEPKLKELLEQK